MKGISLLLLIYLTLKFQVIQTESRPGYVGCFNTYDMHWDIRHMENGLYNNGAKCVHLCLSSRYIYAATRSHDCYCAHVVQPYVRSSTCATRCPRYRAETCGGLYGLSVYDVRVFNRTEVAVTHAPSHTTKHLGISTGQVIISTERVNISTEGQVIIPAERVDISTEQVDKERESRPGYVGCFNKDDMRWDIRHMERGLYNNGAKCVHLCLSSRYIYAATWSRDCYCAHVVQTYVGRSTCATPCPWYRAETCGGLYGLSVYDVRVFNRTEVAVIHAPSHTTKHLGISTGQVIISTERVNISTEGQVIIPTERVDISTEQVDKERGHEGSSSTHLAINVSVPVVLIAVLTFSAVVFFFWWKRRQADDRFVCFRRNKTTVPKPQPSHLLNDVERESKNENRLNDDKVLANDTRKSGTCVSRAMAIENENPEIMYNTISETHDDPVEIYNDVHLHSAYSHVNKTSPQSGYTISDTLDPRAENVPVNGRNENGANANTAYDKINFKSKTNKTNTSPGVVSAYNHVDFDHHSNITAPCFDPAYDHANFDRQPNKSAPCFDPAYDHVNFDHQSNITAPCFNSTYEHVNFDKQSSVEHSQLNIIQRNRETRIKSMDRLNENQQSGKSGVSCRDRDEISLQQYTKYELEPEGETVAIL